MRTEPRPSVPCAIGTEAGGDGRAGPPDEPPAVQPAVPGLRVTTPPPSVAAQRHACGMRVVPTITAPAARRRRTTTWSPSGSSSSFDRDRDPGQRQVRRAVARGRRLLDRPGLGARRRGPDAREGAQRPVTGLAIAASERSTAFADPSRSTSAPTSRALTRASLGRRRKPLTGAMIAASFVARRTSRGACPARRGRMRRPGYPSAVGTRGDVRSFGERIDVSLRTPTRPASAGHPRRAARLGPRAAQRQGRAAREPAVPPARRTAALPRRRRVRRHGAARPRARAAGRARRRPARRARPGQDPPDPHARRPARRVDAGDRRRRAARAPVRADHAGLPAPGRRARRRPAGRVGAPQRPVRREAGHAGHERRRPDRRRRPDQGRRRAARWATRRPSTSAWCRGCTAASSRSTSCRTSPSGSRSRCSTCWRSATSRSAATCCGCRWTCCCVASANPEDYTNRGPHHHAAEGPVRRRDPHPLPARPGPRGRAGAPGGASSSPRCPTTCSRCSPGSPARCASRRRSTSAPASRPGSRSRRPRPWRRRRCAARR